MQSKAARGMSGRSKKGAPVKGRRSARSAPADRLTLGNGLTARGLQVFIAVARFGTMSAAAKHLGMTQPAVSQAIVQIETALGVQLFDRIVRPPALTLQGAALLEPARNIINGIGQFHNALRWGPRTQMPLLRIGMLNSFAEAVGPVVLIRLRSIAAQLIVDTGFTATRTQGVADREFDLIITSDEAPPPPGVDAVLLLSEPLLVVAPQTYRGDLRALKPLSESLDLIRFGRDPHMNLHFDQTLRASGVEPTHAYQMDTQAGVLQMVAAGVGWTILPPLAVHRAMARGEKLRVSPYPHRTMKRVLQLVSRTGEGSVLTADIHDAAARSLRGDYLANVRAFMPGVAEMIKVHGFEQPG
jgi:DNA-binding transcriptional LysR family regulator